MMKAQRRENNQEKASPPILMLLRRISSILSNVEVKMMILPDVVTGMLQVFYINVHGLLHSGFTLSFVTPLVSRDFNGLPDVLIKRLYVTTPVGDSLLLEVSLRVFLYHCPVEFLWST